MAEPERAINFWMLSNLANANISNVPESLRDINLNVMDVYKPPFEPVDVEKRLATRR